MPPFIPFHKRYSLAALAATTRRNAIISDHDRGTYLLDQKANGIYIENGSAETIQIELNQLTDRAITVPPNSMRSLEGKSFEYNQLSIYNKSATSTSNDEVIITVYKLRENEL